MGPSYGLALLDKTVLVLKPRDQLFFPQMFSHLFFLSLDEIICTYASFNSDMFVVRTRQLHRSLPLLVCFLLLIMWYRSSMALTSSTSNIWISMSTCMSSAAPHKAQYSYQASAILSTFLWTQLVGARVILTLVLEEENEDEEALHLQYVLEHLGARVHFMNKEENTSCVLMAQTARMLAYNYHMVKYQWLCLKVPLFSRFQTMT